MTKKRETLLALMTSEAIISLGLFIFIRNWSISHKLFLFFRKLVKRLFFIFGAELIKCFLAIYDFIFGNLTKKKNDYYILFLASVSLQIYYGINLFFEYQYYFTSKERTWIRFLNFPDFIHLQKDLNCCGFQAPFDHRGTRCQDPPSEIGCLSRILSNYSGHMQIFGLLLFLEAFLNITSIVIVYKLSHKDIPKALQDQENPQPETLHF